MPNPSSNIMRTVYISLFLMILNACATPAQHEQMASRSFGFSGISQNSAMYHAIAIAKVGGGEEANPLMTSKVSNKELESALRESMKQGGFLFDSDVKAPYRLEVFLIDLKQPMSGFTTIVDSFIHYKLIRNSDGKSIYDDIITASYKATMDDAFLGVKRLKIANEGSIRANIITFMEHLYLLNVTLPAPL